MVTLCGLTPTQAFTFFRLFGLLPTMSHVEESLTALIGFLKNHFSGFWIYR